MRSADVCQCWGAVFFAGILKKTSAFACAGLPCNTAIPHPFGMNSGQAAHCSFGSDAAAASDRSPGAPSAGAIASRSEAAAKVTVRRFMASPQCFFGGDTLKPRAWEQALERAWKPDPRSLRESTSRFCFYSRGRIARQSIRAIADAQHISLLESLSLHRLSIHEAAVRAVHIEDRHLAAIHQESRVITAHCVRGNANVAALRAADRDDVADQENRIAVVIDRNQRELGTCRWRCLRRDQRGVRDLGGVDARSRELD